ncbi:hypothetical protein HDV03_003122 [Kappamyces sp. JEL0829]|nr:hypothetical protein HDV03_003107 [Kappamyces sp. JEL0829]KAJ3304136.1 hypothetical protein HDV03_003122 [Kappamyces sp. JEL0829]
MAVVSLCFTVFVFLVNIVFTIRSYRIHKYFTLDLVTVPVGCVLVLLATGLIPPSLLVSAIAGSAHAIQPFSILLLFYGFAYMALGIDATGLLSHLAALVSLRSTTAPRLQYSLFYLTSLFLSILFGNDPVILSQTPFLLYFCKQRRYDPLAWVLGEFTAANVGSMLLFVGNPTNLIVVEGMQVGLLEWTSWMALPFLVCSLAGLVVCVVQAKLPDIDLAAASAMELTEGPFGDQTPETFEPVPTEAPAVADEAAATPSMLQDPFGAFVGSLLFIICILLSCLLPFFDPSFPIWSLSLAFWVAKMAFDVLWDTFRFHRGALAKIPLPSHASLLEQLYIACMNRSPSLAGTLLKLPWKLLPFLLCQFILVEALDHQGLIDVIIRWWSFLQAPQLSTWALAFFFGSVMIVLCACCTNILATVFLVKIVTQLGLTATQLKASAMAIGVASNIGAISPIFSASLAGLLWKDILAQKGVEIHMAVFSRWNLGLGILLCGLGFSLCALQADTLFQPR